MANIKVDHSQFERTATAIDTYIRNHKSKMNSIDNSITALGTAWQGSDYNQLQTEWQQIKGSDSTSAKMLKSLDSYADFLRFAANKYKSAQASAINRANRLPKY